MNKAALKRRQEMLQNVNPSRNAWLQGYAAALAQVNRLFDQPTIIASVLATDSISGFRLQYAGAEKFDIKELKKAYAHQSPSVAKNKWNGSTPSTRTAAARRRHAALDDFR